MGLGASVFGKNQRLAGSFEACFDPKRDLPLQNLYHKKEIKKHKERIQRKEAYLKLKKQQQFENTQKMSNLVPNDMETDITDVKQIEDKLKEKIKEMSLGGTAKPNKSVIFDIKDDKQSPSVDDFEVGVWKAVDNEGRPIEDSVEMDPLKDQTIADKSIADCVEALISVYLLECGMSAAQRLLCNFGIPVLQSSGKGKDVIWQKLSAPDVSLLNADVTQVEIDDVYNRHQLCKGSEKLGSKRR